MAARLARAGGGLIAAAPIAAIAAIAARPIALVLAAVIAGFAVAEASVAPDNDSAGTRPDALWAAATALALLAIWCVAAATAETSAAAVATGLALFAAGAAARVAAIRALGDRFSSGSRVAPASDLETRGLYARARHPSELGILALAAGAAVMMSSAAAAVGAVALVPLIGARTRREDRQLAAVFGEPLTRR